MVILRFCSLNLRTFRSFSNSSVEKEANPSPESLSGTLTFEGEKPFPRRKLSRLPGCQLAGIPEKAILSLDLIWLA